MITVARRIGYFIVSGIFALVVGLILAMGLGALASVVSGGQPEGLAFIGMSIGVAIGVIFVWWFTYAIMHRNYLREHGDPGAHL